MKEDYSDIIRLFEQARFDAGAIAREIVTIEKIGPSERGFLRSRVMEVLDSLEKAAAKLRIDIRRKR